MNYIKRILEDRIKEVLQTHAVIVLTGPRQVGKSTLLQQAEFLKGWKYLTLDDLDVLEQAKEDPKGLLHAEQPTIIDEVQRHTPLFLTIKYLVDQSKGKRKFILSGSGNVSLRKSPRETLAGRAKYLYLTPLGLREIDGSVTTEDGYLKQYLLDQEILEKNIDDKRDYIKSIWRGGLPKIVLASSVKACLEILSGYIDTYLQRDIQDLVQIRHPQNFRALMQALAKSTGWEVVQEELSKLCSESRVNVSRYMSLLKETGLLYELKGYVSQKERAYRQSKYYWFDSAVAVFLSHIHSPKDLLQENVKGRYFENFVLQQILCLISTEVIAPEIYYWKLKNNAAEVDFVLKQRDFLIPIEVKSKPQLSFGDTKGIRQFMKSHAQAQRGIIVYTGTKIYQIATNIHALPYTAL